MANYTVINPSLQESAPTEINAAISGENTGVSEVSEVISHSIAPGTNICQKYVITKKLDVASGEADLYLCSYRKKKFVAKVYKRKIAIKQEVIDKLKKINSPYVAKIYDTGSYEGFPLEILPYYENGSILGKKFSYNHISKVITHNINEGLKAIHDAGIIHKDLKPSNIMLNDDKKTVSIIDFGISSAVEDNNTILVTKTGMTPEYSAPETFRNVYYEGSDYYSMGITLFELFYGYTPFANMQAEEIDQYVSVQRINFTDKMPKPLKDLITALTYFDIRNRKDKDNPNRRWTYEEVKKWIAGEKLPIPGFGVGGVEKNTIPPFEFMGESYTDTDALVDALAKNWEEGKKQLFRGHITTHFKNFNNDIAIKCQSAEKEAQNCNGKDDIIFWKLLYKINPGMKKFYWKGLHFENIAAFGRDVLERLWQNDESQFPYYASVLSEKVLTEYVNVTASKNETLKKVAETLENSYALELINKTGFKRTFFLMAYTLSGQRILLFKGNQYRTVEEFANYMRNVLEKSPKQFEMICHELVDYEGDLDFQLETWLIALGKQKELDKWRKSLN